MVNYFTCVLKPDTRTFVAHKFVIKKHTEINNEMFMFLKDLLIIIKLWIDTHFSQI